MGYLGLTPTTAQQNYLNIDDISGSFNGTTTSFALQVGGVAPTPFPVTNSCLISVGGVIQEPDDTGTSGFRISGGNIVFSSAPGTGEDFFGLILAGADYLNVGANFPDGTVGTPSITFDSDTNTGIYHPSADELSFVTGGSDRVRVDSNGRLGIGTSSPGALLNTRWTGTRAGSTGVHFATSHGDSSDYTLLKVSTSEGGTDAATKFLITGEGKVGIGTASPSVNLQVQNDSSFSLIRVIASSSNLAGIDFGDAADIDRGSVRYDNATDSMAFTVNASERARIDSSGRFLVGTSTSNSNTNSRFQIADTSGNVTTTSYSANNSSSGYYYFFKNRGASVDSHTVLQSGDGIANLYFGGSDGTTYRGAASIEVLVDGTPGANDMPGRLVFSTTADGASSPTERMRIIQQGHVKISSDGTYNGSGADYHEIRQSVSNTLLYCSHSFNFGATAGNYGQVIDFAVHSPDNNSSSFLTCKDQTANRMFIYSDGDVWTSDAGILTSDETLKRDITDASPKLADVMNLRVRNFYWEEDYHPNKQDKKLIGFVAQEFEKVFPGLVSEHRVKDGDPILDENGNDTGEKTPDVFKKGIKEAKLVPILVKALQEAVERIEALEAEVAALKAQ